MHNIHCFMNIMHNYALGFVSDALGMHNVSHCATRIRFNVSVDLVYFGYCIIIHCVVCYANLLKKDIS